MITAAQRYAYCFYLQRLLSIINRSDKNINCNLLIILTL